MGSDVASRAYGVRAARGWLHRPTWSDHARCGDHLRAPVREACGRWRV